ncbi:NAD(P)/FAD-dependent oxidoreductase [Thalassotalea aquiviva]|uniref:NAD(P)/FAD-dependent oxidoreductase n=1 Tax=Thalassotalea aquiviva TaxID=3242415 RepID=UPI003529E84C
MYDPLHDRHPGENNPYPNSYWSEHSGEAPLDDGQLTQDIDADVVIIGAGYTGLSCALHLARAYGIKAIVLEANQTAWGCSGRNAGFILKSTGRKPWSDMAKEWGEEVMRGIYQEVCDGVETVKSLIDEGIDCDPQTPGYIRVAHKASMFPDLVEQAKLLRKRFNYQVDILSREDIHQQFMADQNAYGAIRFHDGIGINPLKLAWGYQRLARAEGVRIHPGTPVLHWTESDNKQVLVTPKARVKASKVVLATNGYTPKGLHLSVANRTLPVLSQIIVTEPLSEEQIQQCNFLTSNVVMDTRALKYYYRKLPDNRILFGGRGAITGKSAEDPYYANRLLKVLKQSFPALANLTYQHAWSGWICMSLDDIPHINSAENNSNVVYAMGYCGNGVSFSVQAGKRLADKIAGKALPNIPLYQKNLPKFPLPALRRVGQWGYFHYGLIKDKFF